MWWRHFQNVDKELDNFYRLYGKWRSGISDELVWDKIRPLPESMLQVTSEIVCDFVTGYV